MSDMHTRGSTCDKCDVMFPSTEGHVCPGADPPAKTRTEAQAFNEWMRRYADEPERFAREFKTVGEFLAQESRGETPTYGDECAAYLAELMTEEVA